MERGRRAENRRRLCYLCKVSSQSHLAPLPQRTQQAGVADEQLDGSLGDRLCALEYEVHTLEVPEIVCHDSGDKTLQLLHVQGARNIGSVGAGQRPAAHTSHHREKCV